MGIFKASVDTEVNILQNRKEESLTPDMKEVIKILTLDPKHPPQLVGSFRYKVHEYPSDMDLYEPVQTCCSLDAGVREVVAGLQAMVRRLQKRRFTYLSDFKAGVDDRYAVDIGKYDVLRGKLEGYDQFRVVDAIVNIYQKGLFTKSEAVGLLRMAHARPDAYQHHKLQDALRKWYVVRWTEKELLEGSKMLAQDKKITLAEAVSQGTVVKADLWALVDDRFMEVTNWFMLTAKVREGVKYLSEKPDLSYEQSVMQDVMLFKDPRFKKHMKLAKRMWLHAISQKDHYTIQQLYPLFSSPIAKLYQIQSEIEILMGMLDKLPQPPYRLIQKQVAQFKTRISTVPEAYMSEEKEKAVLGHLDRAILAKKDAGAVVKSLERAFHIVLDIVDHGALRYIQKNVPKNDTVKKLLRALKRRK